MGERSDRVRRHQHHGLSHRGCHSTSRQGLPGRLASHGSQHVSRRRSWIHFRTYTHSRTYLFSPQRSLLLRDFIVSFFLRLFSYLCVADSASRQLYGTVSREKTTHRTKSSEHFSTIPSPLPGESNISSGFFVAFNDDNETFVRGMRIKQESSGGCRSVGKQTRAAPFARLCVHSGLRPKLVKLHPHVETWTFQRVYKVPPVSCRLCFTFLLMIPPSIHFFSQIFERIW